MGLNKFFRSLTALTVVGGIVAGVSLSAYAATLTTASLGLQDSRINQVSQYTLTANGWSTGSTIGCIEVDLGSSSDGTGSVTGLSTASSTLVSQSVTATGTWTVSNTASANHALRITNATPIAAQTGSQTIVWGNVTNGSTANTGYFAVVKSYTDNTCATPVDTVTVQFVFTDGQSTSVSVDGTLTFSVTGVTGDGVATVNGATITNGVTTTASTIPFGTATASANRVAAQDLAVATNAGNGYTVFARYTGQLTNGGSAAIDNLAAAPNSAPISFTAAGTEGFGYTTADATLGTGTAGRFSGNKWAAFTTSNQEIIFNSAPTVSETTRVGYQVGVATTTDPGTYNTTVIYTATPVY